MVDSTLVSTMTAVVERASTPSLTKKSSWETGKKTNIMGKEPTSMHLGRSIKENLWMESGMGRECTLIEVGPSMMESGTKIARMASAFILTPTAKNTRAIG